MAIHVPICIEARLEAMMLMMTSINIKHPAHGGVCIVPTQDMLIGLHYMSLTSVEEEKITFSSYSDIKVALFNNLIGLHSKVYFRYDISKSSTTIVSTPGRLLITELVPIKCNFVYE